MDKTIWILLVAMTVLLWASTSLLYKKGAEDVKEKFICLKYSVCIGVVFFVIALAYLIIRNEPFTIWESALRFWPVTLFGIIYPILNTVSFKGYVYNEATVESPVEGIAGGTSTILLIIAYLALGRVDSISKLLTPLRSAGILVILICVILLSTVRNKEAKQSGKYEDKKWMRLGLGTLIFPVIFALADAMETIVTGVCLDKNYGFAMPEGDSIIIIGMEYAIFALGFWIYILVKEKKAYNPFTKKSAPRLLGALTDNIAICLYSYAMALNSVSTDPILAVYPVFVMIGGRVFMKEKVSLAQYIFLIGIVAGSVLVVIDTSL